MMVATQQVLQNQGGKIFNFFPQNFEITESTPEALLGPSIKYL